MDSDSLLIAAVRTAIDDLPSVLTHNPVLGAAGVFALQFHDTVDADGWWLLGDNFPGKLKLPRTIAEAQRLYQETRAAPPQYRWRREMGWPRRVAMWFYEDCLTGVDPSLIPE